MKLLLLALVPALLNAQQKEKPTGLRPSLIAENQTIVPGEPFTVGFHLEHEPGYHTYWENPGIVGMATQLKWDLPPGFSASPIIWPYPEVSDMAGHPCHGYERDVTLLTIITPPERIESETVTLKATAAWMCCAKGCYPGNTEFSLTLPISAQNQPNPASAALIAKARKEVPKKSKDWTVRLLPKSTPSQLVLSFQGPLGEEPAYFFSTDGQISSDQKQTFRKTAPSTWELTIARAQFSPQDKDNVPGILETSLSHHFVVSPSQ